MLHPRLRLAAARFTLELADVNELVDASHAALDDAFYADGLAVIATTPSMSRWDAAPHFTAALLELGHDFATQDDALRHIRASYFGLIAEGVISPQAGLDRYYEDVHDAAPLSFTELVAWEQPSARGLISHWISLWDHQDPGIATAEWEEQAVQLAREWCLEYGQLLLQPAWRSETVVALATGIYAERAFDRLPILADALEEAGCDHPDVLAHCRGPGPHARGCWVVDLVLDKT